MDANAVDAIDDVPDDDADADGKKRNNDANGDVPEDDRRPGFPHKVKNRRNILERTHAIAPGAALTFVALLLRSLRFSVRLEYPVG